MSEGKLKGTLVILEAELMCPNALWRSVSNEPLGKHKKMKIMVVVQSEVYREKEDQAGSQQTPKMGKD